MESSRKRSQKLLRLALRQGGWFTARQAAALGYDTQHLAYHLRVRNCRRGGRGLYRLAVLPEADDSAMHAALLWSCDRRGKMQAVLGAQSALWLHGLEREPAQICLRLPEGHRRRPPRGVCAHYGPALAREDLVLVRGLRCQAPKSVLRELLAGSAREQAIARRALKLRRSPRSRST